MEGPQSHHAKRGTPTMGGLGVVCFLVGFTKLHNLRVDAKGK
ncbi:hypothetical protein ACFXPR_36115 [Nocardia tengchongensis]